MSASTHIVALTADEASFADLKRGFEGIALQLADLSDIASEVRNDLFCGDKLRPDLFTIECCSAGRADRLRVRFQLTDRFRELALALAARELDRKRGQVIGHGASL